MPRLPARTSRRRRRLSAFRRGERPARCRRLPLRFCARIAAREIRPRTARSARFRARDRRGDAHVRHRPGRNGQNLSRRRHGGARAQKSRGVPHRAFAPRRRSGRTTGISYRGISAKRSIPICGRSSTRLHDLLDDSWSRSTSSVERLKSRRWRTCAAGPLSDAFVILDEAQNATGDQIKMFLDPFGERFEDGRHRRRDSNRFAFRRTQRVTGRGERVWPASKT